MDTQTKFSITNVPIAELIPAEYNPRKWDKPSLEQLKQSISRFDIVDPVIVNCAENRKNIVIGGHMRLQAAKELGYTEVPAVFVNIPEVESEKELNLRLNRNTGAWDWDLLAKFDESLLSDIGFTSKELDEAFPHTDNPEEFDLQKELEKIGITQVTMQKGEIYQLGNSRLMVGDSTIENNVLMLMDGQKASFCLTDPPYILDYLNGKKKHGTAVTGFGARRDRRYLETDILPPDFTEKWMASVHAVQAENFSIICFENWKNIRTIWGEMEKYWRVKNMLVWHIPNRHQGFSAKYKFFSKYDIALAAAAPDVNIEFNNEPEEDGLHQEFETALFAISGKPQWESYEHGKRYQPTDFIEYVASDEKSSQQGIIFGTKPVQILIPYLKVLSRRDDLIIEPFGGSGSTLIAATKMKRRCFVMEKVPAYAEVIRVRWEKLTGQKAVKING